jgi:hypothetical protein
MTGKFGVDPLGAGIDRKCGSALTLLGVASAGFGSRD